MTATKTTEMFLGEAIKLHGDRYIYDNVVYRGAHKRVEIICRVHGKFEQMPANHLKGKGCYQCGTRTAQVSRTKTDEAVFARARAVHGDRYSYAKSVYRGRFTNLIITCHAHGDFEQLPGNHLAGNGCPECRREKMSAQFRYSLEEFIVKARAVHGDRYEYIEMSNEINNNRARIVCSVHGAFESPSDRHLRGHGCPKCGYNEMGERRTNTREMFVEKARQVHGSQYGYDNVVYRAARQRVLITCPLHGDFKQSPDNHLHGNGCPQCVVRVSRKEVAWLDSLNVPERQVTVKLADGIRRLDGYDPASRTAYLFHGTYWHGHPSYYPPERTHPTCGITFGELYHRTLKTEQDLIDAGYMLIVMWEHDWSKIYNRKLAQAKLI